jgi:cold shock CspA family protein
MADSRRLGVRSGRIVHVDLGGMFAFIRPDDGTPDVFIGRKVLEALGLRHGERVEYAPVAGGTGRRQFAAEVKRVTA